MNKTSRFILIIIAILVTNSALQAEDKVFTFDLPDSLSYTKGVFIAHARMANGEVGLVDTIKSFYQDQFIKSPIGYDLHSVPDSIFTTRDGKPLNSPIVTAMGKTSTVIVLDDEGHAMSVQGFDKLIDNIDIDDSTLMAEIRSNTNAKAMAEKVASEWNSIIDPIVGQKLSVGVINRLQEDYQFGSRTRLEFFTSVEVADTFQIDGVLCARIFLHSDSDISRLAKRREVDIKELLKAFGMTADDLDDNPNAASSMKVVQIVLEVETMKLLGVQSRIQITLVAPGDDKAEQALQLVEIKDSRYIYDPVTP